MEKTYFFGWTNIKWLIRELMKMYSSKPSFFSHKRFQTGVAFFTFIQGAFYTLYNLVKTLEDFFIWCIPVLLICGYVLNKTEIANQPPNTDIGVNSKVEPTEDETK